MSPSQDNAGYPGAQGLNDGTSDFNAISFIVQQMLGRVSTCTLVRVQAVAAGTVDVLPLVAQINGAGQPTPHLTVYGIPYVRIQGGANAVIIDPVIGDIGVCVFADRDISSVKATKAAANPGSRRRFSIADGLYIGGVLNGTPTQYVRFNVDGTISVLSPHGVNVAAETNITGSLSVTGNVLVGNGASGTFTSANGLTITVQDGIVTNIF